MSDHEIGARLKLAREHLGHNIATMAQIVGMSHRGYQDNENGNRTPKSTVLVKFVEIGFSATWLLTGEGPMRLDDAFSQEQQKDTVLALFDNDAEAELRRDERAIARVNEIIEFNNLMMKGLSHLDEDRIKLWNAVLCDLVQRQVVTREDTLALLNITKN